MRNVTLSVILLSAVACGQNRTQSEITPEKEFDSRLEVYLADYVRAASAHGAALDGLPTLRRMAVVDTVTASHAAGGCLLFEEKANGPKTFVQKGKWSKKVVWREIRIAASLLPEDGRPDWSLRFAMWHELGHCLQERQHLPRGEFGIMQASVPVSAMIEVNWEALAEAHFTGNSFDVKPIIAF